MKAPDQKGTQDTSTRSSTRWLAVASTTVGVVSFLAGLFPEIVNLPNIIFHRNSGNLTWAVDRITLVVPALIAVAVSLFSVIFSYWRVLNEQVNENDTAAVQRRIRTAYREALDLSTLNPRVKA
jgi:hypothetical protein